MANLKGGAALSTCTPVCWAAGKPLLGLFSEKLLLISAVLTLQSPRVEPSLCLCRKRRAQAPASLAPAPWFLFKILALWLPVKHRSNFSVLRSVNLLVLIKTVKQVA